MLRMCVFLQRNEMLGVFSPNKGRIISLRHKSVYMLLGCIADGSLTCNRLSAKSDILKWKT